MQETDSQHELGSKENPIKIEAGGMKDAEGELVDKIFGLYGADIRTNELEQYNQSAKIHVSYQNPDFSVNVELWLSTRTEGDSPVKLSMFNYDAFKVADENATHDEIFSYGLRMQLFVDAVDSKLAKRVKKTVVEKHEP